MSAPLLPGVPQPVGAVEHDAQAMHALTTPVVAGAVAMSPLIRPLTTAPQVTLTAWSTASEFETPGLSLVPRPDSSASPSPSSSG
jgi:hypothetical protein